MLEQYTGIEQGFLTPGVIARWQGLTKPRQ